MWLRYRTLRALVLGLCLGAFLDVEVSGQSTIEPPDPALADSLSKKLQTIREHSDQGNADPSEVEVTEEEANAYLVHRLSGRLPEGVIAPWVQFKEGLMVAGALLDLDMFQDRLSGSSMAQYLTGRVPVEIRASLNAEGGVGKIDLQSVTLGGLPIPRSFVRELVASNTKSSERPNGVQLDEPFPLPHGIRSLRTLNGRILVRQGLDPEKPGASP